MRRSILFFISVLLIGNLVFAWSLQKVARRTIATAVTASPTIAKKTTEETKVAKKVEKEK